MGRGVEDLSGRCHVKRMSRRKERLGFFFCNSVFAHRKKSGARTRPHSPSACARSLAQTAPPLLFVRMHLFKKLFAFAAASGFNAVSLRADLGDKFSMSRNPKGLIAF